MSAERPCRRLPVHPRLEARRRGCKKRWMRPLAEAEALKLQA
ncbi:MAG: hypothetical protein ACYDHX_05320 [Methanothrix sp.]